MSEDTRTAAEQWGIPATENNVQEPPATEIPYNTVGETEKQETGYPTAPIVMQETTVTDILKRRGFFESLKQVECPQQQLGILLAGYEEQAKTRLQDIDLLTNKKIEHLQERILSSKEKLALLKERLVAAKQYKEADDPDLQLLVQAKEHEERLLQELLDKFTDVKIRLGEAKAGIIRKSLEEAAEQVEKALQIQRTVYDETRLLNQKKFNDEKDYLARLSKCFQELYTTYESRYQKVNQHLRVLDVDGISPVTTQVLTTIGTISFGAAGFFFSTFAGNTGFGNQDVLYFVLGGFIDTAKLSTNGFAALALLVGLIGLITFVSWGCNRLINRLKKGSEDEILSEFGFTAKVAKKLKAFEYQALVKSNNWYGFWLQLVPGILIAGLIIVSISLTPYASQLGALNTSSEGLIVGTSIAISLAGLIYLYIVKIVEPRLVRRYNSNPDQRINWARSNWELVVILAAFLVFSICIIAIPYNAANSSGIISLGQRTRYAILLFIAICLVGAMSFAYSVRSRGLIETNRFLEKVMRWLNNAIAYCSSAEAPDLYNDLTEEQGNIVQHVLKQFSFKANINSPELDRSKKKEKEKKTFGHFMQFLMGKKHEAATPAQEPVKILMIIEPWEERYFPHLIDEIRAVEFEYLERKARLLRAEDDIDDYRSAKISYLEKCETDVGLCEGEIRECEDRIETAIEEKSLRYQRSLDQHNKDIADVLDGFHLGLWYRENDMGPVPGYFSSCKPGTSSSPVHLIDSSLPVHI